MGLSTLEGERVTLRPLAERDVDALMEIIASPEVREWWGQIESVDEQREELAQNPAFAIEVDGELAGWLGFYEENDPQYRHAALDIVLAGPFQDRGLGTEALRLAIRWLIERGHHRFTIDPARANERAIRAYRAIGFRDVGVLRRYERGLDGEWRDGLLMDLLADELR